MRFRGRFSQGRPGFPAKVTIPGSLFARPARVPGKCCDSGVAFRKADPGSRQRLRFRGVFSQGRPGFTAKVAIPGSLSARPAWIHGKGCDSEVAFRKAGPGSRQRLRFRGVFSQGRPRFPAKVAIPGSLSARPAWIHGKGCDSEVSFRKVGLDSRQRLRFRSRFSQGRPRFQTKVAIPGSLFARSTPMPDKGCDSTASADSIKPTCIKVQVGFIIGYIIG
ncbi:hypothetical protein ABHD89_001932 [Salinicoccus halitifaciens]|uniref:Uncharacterized protein n=1 Tax=Salinicoccus halitifaciens TaxID=1073415 RepID=A0ABV2EAR3_9STAP